MHATTIKPHIINKPRRVMRNAFIITLLMIAGAIITGYSGLDGMKGGYALIVLFGFAALVALITALMYLPRARAFDKLVNNLQPLAHWTYSQAEWDAYTRENYKETLAMNRSTLKLVSIIAVVVCAVLLLLYHDKLFIIIIAGLILLLAIVAFLAPVIQRNNLRKGVHEAYIGKDAAYVGGSFQNWNQTGVRLSGAGIYTEGAIPLIHFMLEYLTLQGAQQNIFRVPVPAGKIEEAKAVLEKIQKGVV